MKKINKFAMFILVMDGIVISHLLSVIFNTELYSLSNIYSFIIPIFKAYNILAICMFTLSLIAMSNSEVRKSTVDKLLSGGDYKNTIYRYYINLLFNMLLLLLPFFLNKDFLFIAQLTLVSFILNESFLSIIRSEIKKRKTEEMKKYEDDLNKEFNNLGGMK